MLLNKLSLHKRSVNLTTFRSTYYIYNNKIKKLVIYSLLANHAYTKCVSIYLIYLTSCRMILFYYYNHEMYKHI